MLCKYQLLGYFIACIVVLWYTHGLKKTIVMNFSFQGLYACISCGLGMALFKQPIQLT